MEKNELLEGLVMKIPVLDAGATGTRAGDTVGYDHNGSCSVTISVIFSTLVAVSGAYAFGSAVGYSSPAKTGITEDLGLSLAQIFPINIKGSGGSLVNLMNWASSWVVSYTFTFLFEWNSAGTFFIFAFIGGVGILFIGKLVPETKGRTLEELQTCCGE